MVNVVPREVPRPKHEGPQALRVLAAQYTSPGCYKDVLCKAYSGEHNNSTLSLGIWPCLKGELFCGTLKKELYCFALYIQFSVYSSNVFFGNQYTV